MAEILISHFFFGYRNAASSINAGTNTPSVMKNSMIGTV